MATHLYCGQPGAGKTTAAIGRSVVPWVEDGGIIVTNVPLRREAWIERFGDSVSDRLIELPKWVPDPRDGLRRSFSAKEDFESHMETKDAKGRGVMFVIDEAHEVMPKGMRFLVDKITGQRLDTYPNWLLLLFTMQRHHLINFVLITQDPLSMAPDLLGQVHSSFYVQNAAMKGSAKRWTAKIWNKRPPRNFETVKFAECDDSIQVPQPYDPEVQRLFKSNTGIKDDIPVDRSLEGKYQHARSVFKRPAMLLAVFGGLGLVVFFALSLLTKATSDGSAAAVPKAQAVARPSSSPSPSPSPSPSSPPEFRPQDVISDLRTVQQDSANVELAAGEARLFVSLAIMDGVMTGDRDRRRGPILRVLDPSDGRVGYHYLTDYASWWGYAIQSASCGWSLTRPGKTRYVYDHSCLSKGPSNGSSSFFAPDASQAAGDDAKPLGGSPAPVATPPL